MGPVVIGLLNRVIGLQLGPILLISLFLLRLYISLQAAAQ